MSAATSLTELEQIVRDYGPGLARRKLALIARLERTQLPSAAAVTRYHEALAFLHAYPDDLAVRRRVVRALRAFARRRDLVRFAPRLASSGIAGTRIDYRFYAKMAAWLATRWPKRLSVDWREFEQGPLLEALLPHLALPAESLGLDEYAFGLRRWVARLKSPRESDAAFLVRRIAQLPMSAALRVTLVDVLDTPMSLAPGPGGPTRTGVEAPAMRNAAGRVVWPRAVVPQRQPLSRERPDLAAESRRPPLRMRAVSLADGERLCELAREAMVTRQRDLDAFANADPRDVRIAEFEDGLSFVCYGVRPEDRLMFDAVYGYLTIKNGVPIGYVLTSSLYGSCEMAYNVFETYRGAEASLVYARVLALCRHLFDADAFTIYPYQLGQDNDEAIASGAWWFYYKLGFRPRDAATRRLVRRELSRMERDLSYRSNAATLRRLARRHLYLHLGRDRRDVMGLLPFANVGLAVTDRIAREFGADRARAEDECADRVQRLLGVRDLLGWSAGERLAWRRWAPIALALPGVARWSAAERRALALVIRAKGGRRESDFVRLFDAHEPLRRAVLALGARRR